MNARRLCFSLILFLLTRLSFADLPHVDVFTSGQDDYHTFRIPAVILTPKGDLLAFAEGRKSGRGDSGDIDLVYKRSSDRGKTWSPLKVLWNDGKNTCGNPCPVVDESNGRILLPLTWNHGEDHESEIKSNRGKDTRRVFLSWSDDDGHTWTPPKEITSEAKHPDWTWYATGPGNAIQLKQGSHRGRIVVPCDHNILDGKESVRRSHCIYSDDGGVSWKISEPLGRDTNECAVVELSDGTLLLNMRSYHGKNRRAIARSSDGGHSWSEVTLDETLIEPVCQASLVSLGGNKLAFSNPASKKRKKMTLRFSADGGKTWTHSQEIHAGTAAYSCLVPIDQSTVGLIYERDNYGLISFTSLPIPQFQK